eukprot:CAMPEP_0177653744 /NCGR_PEP_ID=MMETSP0447-20121125/13916_1 /TAXON_ID=0 /ORGANISM="Stygamoeba regulata, Strain BSH-02190019" /LENGTH=90 /DNA_ID=CAMNT_0019157255 /DNA_START=66 /DNA_END=338 /DNA_ORIENTATION=+
MAAAAGKAAKTALKSNLNMHRRLAASILKCGETKIWFDPTQLRVIQGARTREDVRSLIEEKLVQKIVGPRIKQHDVRVLKMRDRENRQGR